MKKLITFFGVWIVATTAAVLTVGWSNPSLRAVVLMGMGLLVLWVIFAGLIMYKTRDRVRNMLLRLPGPWQLKFVAFATLLACIEEAITTLMTNSAPLFGVEMGQAYITASANYFDVIFFHSVIVFVPMFIGWTFLLSRYRFTPNQVFLLFGLTGLLAETLTFGPHNMSMFAFWIMVYGLMVYLPAYSIPDRPNAREPRWYHFLLALILPPLCNVILFPLYLLGYPQHPPIHFPPMQ